MMQKKNIRVGWTCLQYQAYMYIKKLSASKYWLY